MPTIPVRSSSLIGAAPIVNRTVPSDNANAGASIPVYVVAAQVLDYDPPNTQDNAAGAIPINLTTLGARPDAIPIRIVSGTGSSWGSDQSNDLNAIPVFYSDRWDAIPVWNARISGESRAPSSNVVSITARTPIMT